MKGTVNSDDIELLFFFELTKGLDLLNIVPENDLLISSSYIRVSRLVVPGIDLARMYFTG